MIYKRSCITANLDRKSAAACHCFQKAIYIYCTSEMRTINPNVSIAYTKTLTVRSRRSQWLTLWTAQLLTALKTRLSLREQAEYPLWIMISPCRARLVGLWPLKHHWYVQNTKQMLCLWGSTFKFNCNRGFNSPQRHCTLSEASYPAVLWCLALLWCCW